MFAETIVLVEGATEFFALPVYLKRIGFSLAEHGVEIVNCRGKDCSLLCGLSVCPRLKIVSQKYPSFRLSLGDKV